MIGDTQRALDELEIPKKELAEIIKREEITWKN
jgi:hypothetical protein